MKMRPLAPSPIRSAGLLAFFLLLHALAPAQVTPAALLKLVNAARSNPKAFLSQHGEALRTHSPALATTLATAKPAPPVAADPGLDAWCKASLAGNLNPKYSGKADFCGQGSGNMTQCAPFQPFELLALWESQVMDPNCVYLGLAFAAGASQHKFSFCWAYRCDEIRVPFAWEGKVDSSEVDWARLETAAKVPGLSAEERWMIRELNFIRAYPQVYAQLVRAHMAQDALAHDGLAFDEHAAGMELLEQLDGMEPLEILQPMPCVQKAARKHAQDCAQRGFTDHTGSDGSSPFDRIGQACPDLAGGNENLAGGYRRTRDAVMGLMIDSGISGRGHRENILDPNWRYVGVAVTLSSKKEKQYVQNFAY